MRETEVYNISYYIKVGKVYVRSVNKYEVTFSNRRDKRMDTLYSEDKDKGFEDKVAKRLSRLIDDLVSFGYERDEIVIEAVKETTTTDVDKVKVVEEKEGSLLGNRTYKIEKVKPKISSGSVTLGTLGAGEFVLGGVKDWNTIPVTMHIHPNTYDFKEYQIVEFDIDIPYLNVEKGDKAVVVSVGIDSLFINKNGSEFYVAKRHVYPAKI